MNFTIIIKEYFLDIIFPKECLGCGQEGAYLCKKCLNKIQLNRHFGCGLCHQQSAWGKICPACQEATVIKAIWVAANYNDPLLQNAIHYLKYKYVEEVAAGLAQIIWQYLELNKILENFGLNKDNTVLCPVPLHKKRFLIRGFNQSELLAKSLSSLSGFPKADLLLRKVNTQTQVELTRNERQQNVRGAFDLKNNCQQFNNKKIILIDDVLTTGSTLNECARALYDKGFAEIYGLVAARRED